MKLSLRSRLVAMVLVILLLAAIIVGSAVITWRQVRNLRRHFSGVRIESFRIADYLQANVLDLNATLWQFVRMSLSAKSDGSSVSCAMSFYSRDQPNQTVS